MQVHQDDIKLNVKLQLFALIAKQAAFHQLRSVEQLGYITALVQRYVEILFPPLVDSSCVSNSKYHILRNDSGVRGVQIIIQSTIKVNLNNTF